MRENYYYLNQSRDSIDNFLTLIYVIYLILQKMNNSKLIKKKCKVIKILLTDVDGVLTDGGMYYTESGERMKKFNARDGMGVELLNKENIKTIFITREKSSIVKKRAIKLNISKCYLGVKNKESLLPKICMDFDVKPAEIAYIGDDVNDLDIMKKVGFTATPKDGIKEIKKIADYTCSKTGGNCAFREITDMIITHRKNNL